MASSANSQVSGNCEASFEYYVDEEAAPLVYSFVGKSVSHYTESWEWDFGNGEKAYTQNPVYTYPREGVYTVSLTITDQEGCQDVAVQVVEVMGTVPKSCYAYFTYLYDDDLPQFTYRFTDHSIYGGDSIIYWRWDFGDGSPISMIQNPIHQYSSTGTYEVVLEIATHNDCISRHSAKIQITAGGVACDASFTHSVDTNSSVPYTVLFHDNSQYTDPILSWTWHFGDGDSSNYRDPKHSFLFPGVYDVSLEIVTTNCTSEVVIPIQVGNPQSYNLWGRVYVGKLTVDQCVAYLFKEYQENYVVPVDTISLTSVDDTLGVYYFYQVPEGNYKVQVVLPPTSEYATTFAPTYFTDGIFWHKSQRVSLFEDLGMQHVYMKEMLIKTSTNYISGSIENNANGQKEGVLVMLISDQGDVVDYTYTDASGNYYFDNAPAGNYAVYGELTGFASFPANISLATSYDTLTQVNFSIEDRSVVGYIEIDPQVNNPDYTLFPNPMTDHRLMLHFSQAVGYDCYYKVFDAMGKIVEQGSVDGGSTTFEISFETLDHGVYFITIIDKEELNYPVKKIIY